MPDVLLAIGDTAVNISFTYLTVYFTIYQMPSTYLVWVRPSYKS